MIKLTALWINKTQKGQSILTGKLGDANIVIMKNGFKKEEKHPDYIVYMSEPQKKEERKEQTEEDSPF